MSINRNLYVSQTKDYRHLGTGIDMQSILRKIEGKLPKNMLTLPGHRFSWIQSTPFEDETDSEGNYLPGHEPFNQIDALALKHDYAYSKALNKSDKHAADKVMLKSLKTLKPKNFREKLINLLFEELLVQSISLG